MPLTVFVTDGNQRSALAIVRTLGRRGMTVIVGDEQPVSLASASRHCAHRITYPSPYAHREAFERFLLDFVAREHVDVLLPVTDVTTHSVCALQDRLEVHTALAVPPLDAFEIVTHKGRLMEYAASLAVPVPRTHCVDGLESLERVVDRVEYPAVVKPVRSSLRTEDGWVPGRVHYAGSPQ
jgi:predicted ATP-grasp superfamily ATP-dependent carboligase